MYRLKVTSTGQNNSSGNGLRQATLTMTDLGSKAARYIPKSDEPWMVLHRPFRHWKLGWRGLWWHNPVTNPDICGWSQHTLGLVETVFCTHRRFLYANNQRKLGFQSRCHIHGWASGRSRGSFLSSVELPRIIPQNIVDNVSTPSAAAQSSYT